MEIRGETDLADVARSYDKVVEGIQMVVREMAVNKSHDHMLFGMQASNSDGIRTRNPSVPPRPGTAGAGIAEPEHAISTCPRMPPHVLAGALLVPAESGGQDGGSVVGTAGLLTGARRRRGGGQMDLNRQSGVADEA
ncbi:hypothetical protein CMUS01_10953 [Colletotrichum musicola]|uniref:Uncharacterized protein n=1 Tax=Colletotrichum musicola TaxID=2175873 RepID=A0A8H6K157_9PEZI|nr:hypothetical protein CMUS01_10953 [Colletotrichum musicola]